MGVGIDRLHKALPNFALTNAIGTSAEIDISAFAGGSVLIPSGSPITLLTLYGCIDPANATSGANNGYGPLHTNDGTDAAITVTVSAGNMYQIPTAMFALGALKIVANAAGKVDLCFSG